MDVSSETISNSVQYKFAYLKKMVIELRSRQKEFYYKYTPPKVNGKWIDGEYVGGVYNPKIINFHKCGKKIRIMKGAPRSGKTTCVLIDAAMIMKGEHPFNDRFKDIPEMAKRCWVIGTTFKKIQEVLMPMFLNVLPKNFVHSVTSEQRSNKYYINLINGWKILFKSQEEKIGTITSTDATLIIMDERVESPDWREQIRSRIISTDGLLYFTMDSNEEDEWVEALKQMDYSEVFEFNIYDNESNLPGEELERLKNELDDVAKEKLIYGKHIDRYIEHVYSKDIWNDSNYVEIVPTRYSVYHGELVPDEQGYIRMFKEKLEGMRYIAGYDPAGGFSRNSHAIQVFDQNGEQCAMMLDNKFHYVNAPEDFILPLLKYYNNACFVSENREHGRYIVNKIVDIGYPNVYSDTMWKPIGTNIKTQIDWGIITNERSKFEMNDSTLNDIINGKLFLHCRLTKMQLEAFVKDYTQKINSKKQSADLRGLRILNEPDLKNSDDDLVMSLYFVDRALNNMGYLINENKKYHRQTVKTIDDLMNIKLIRNTGNSIYTTIGY